MTLTDNKEDRQKTKDLQCMMTHALASITLTAFPSVSGHFTHCWDFVSALRVTNSTVVAVPIYSISDLYANSLQRFTLRKWTCEVWCSHTRRLQQTTVNCKRSNCNKLKNLESRHVWDLSKDGKQRVSPIYHGALHVSSVVDFLWIIMSSTRYRAISTNWKENSMIGASIDTSRMALAWVVVLQILGADGLMWSTLRWIQNDFSMVQCFQTYWERSTNSFGIENFLFASCTGTNYCPQARPSGYRPLHFDHDRVEMY